MSIFKRIFKQKVDDVKKEVDQAEETLQKAEEKIKVLKTVCKISLLREALADLLTQLKKDCHAHWDYNRYGCDDKLNKQFMQKIKDTEKEIGSCLDEMLKERASCRNCS